MPEYLAPGVFVEEVSYRSKSIQGVATSTTGFVGLAHYGPVQYPGGPLATEPRLVTSYVEFERVYGKLEPLLVGGGEQVPYLAYAARAFFLNGGRRLYISRIYAPPAGAGATGVASVAVPIPSPTASTATWRARWPGRMGEVAVTVEAVRSGDVGDHSGQAPKANLVKDGAVLEVVPDGSPLPARNTPVDPDSLRILRVVNEVQSFVLLDGSDAPPAVTDRLLPVEVTVTVVVDAERTDTYTRLGLDPASRRYVGKILAKDDPEDEDCVVWIDYDMTVDTANPISLLMGLVGTDAPVTTVRLDGGSDGNPLNDDGFGGDEADPDDITRKATGLEALAEVDDIAIVAAPDAGAIEDDDVRFAVTQRLVRHAEECRYRIAVVDGPRQASLNAIRAFRGNFDTKYGALYHPWIEVLDPNQPLVAGAAPQKLLLPPSGFVAGIYARTDVERGVFKAPANEVVYGLTRFEANINQRRNEVLNPENINALRFFPGRGNRVWGARTLSSDPEWLYVNVRRLFIYLEHSIDRATQWAVFEPNGEPLWRNITQTVKDFLEVQWRNGALLGSTPEQAYFVRCDRSTMTQNDLDNGRLICLIGVAPVKPAEFVIFRIGQWTADARP
jgi:Bacteriophage tail sheath protein